MGRTLPALMPDRSRTADGPESPLQRMTRLDQLGSIPKVVVQVDHAAPNTIAVGTHRHCCLELPESQGTDVDAVRSRIRTCPSWPTRPRGQEDRPIEFLLKL